MSSSRIIPRLLHAPQRSFFLFGPRGTGKSTWLQAEFPQALTLDLLNADLFLELSRHPDRLAALVADRPTGAWVVIDEIQKVPALLAQVHRLLTPDGPRFALCGSSARKLKRGGADLLAGRALDLRMEGLGSAELGARYDIDAALAWGGLPLVALAPGDAPELLSAYFNTYLKEEIREEGLVRSLPPFLRFLEIAGLLNGQALNALNIAREAAVPRTNVDSYFSILVDTLLGHFLPAYRPNVKVREVARPKFYWFDPGVARAAAGLLFDPADRPWLGTALETLVYHELRVYNQTANRHRPIFYYRTPAGVEIDFVIETRKRRQGSPAHVVCIETKLSTNWRSAYEKPMRSLADSGGNRLAVDRMIGVYTGKRRYDFGDVTVLPVAEFLAQLYAGEVF